uniref:Uncharacterized protein n=1 Tax=viral metagenome TaxID=1070528 RepID=A0A6C0JMZ8_9ZZZZ
MDLQLDNNKILGVPEGVSYGQHERVDELNTRINTRYFPDSPLQPNFDPRSIPTKYSHFPIINRRKPMHEHVVPYLDYNQTINFNPGTQRAPPNGYINNVDTETILRNQMFALQRGGNQGVYIPSSESELYRSYVPSGSINDPQPHPNLFYRQQFDQSPHPNVQGNNIGRDKFFNHTRTQLRGT